jgi:hypothetical protein
MYKNYQIYLICFLLLPAIGFMLTSCNNSNEQYPPGTNVTISPTSTTWTVKEHKNQQGECIYYTDIYQDNVAVITVSDSNRRPMGQMTLELYLSPSQSTSNPDLNLLHSFSLYDDLNQNGVVDHPEELVSESRAPILYKTKTEKYHGTKTVIVRTNTSCGGALGTLHAYAGDGSGIMEISTQTEKEDDEEDDNNDENEDVTD